MVSPNEHRITDGVEPDESSFARNFSSLIEIDAMRQYVMAASHCCSTNLNHLCERHKKHSLGLSTSGHYIHRHGWPSDSSNLAASLKVVRMLMVGNLVDDLESLADFEGSCSPY